MASINGLPPSLIPGTNRTNKVGKKGQVKKAQNKQSVGQPSKVANAVAHSINKLMSPKFIVLKYNMICRKVMLAKPWSSTWMS